jgi:hypothetical protein
MNIDYLSNDGERRSPERQRADNRRTIRNTRDWRIQFTKCDSAATIAAQSSISGDGPMISIQIDVVGKQVRLLQSDAA